MLQVCPNGARSRAECDHIPMSPDELAAAVREAVVAGAQDVHLHPRDDDGADTMEPAFVARAVSAVRQAAPGIPVGVTTGAWTGGDARDRAALVRSWTLRPDHASVNWHEEGAELVARSLLDAGVAVEAGIYSGTDSPERFARSPLAGQVIRVLAEVTDTHPETAADTGSELMERLAPLDGRPTLLHGEDGGAWPVLRLAAARGLDTRIGLEDSLHLPDGMPAPGNADLVRAARAILGR